MSRKMDHEGVILRIIPIISNGFVQSHATAMGRARSPTYGVLLI
jgi:hypothetical protein